jgi:putative NIF3 family GTP cyclohydrolase 1 type 2
MFVFSYDLSGLPFADPIVFTPLKALTLANSQQSSLLKLAQEGISVYCPHTAVDAAPGGLNDWLADVVTDTLHSNDRM